MALSLSLKNFNYQQFLKRLSQEAIVVILLSFLSSYVVIHFVLKRQYNSKIKELNKIQQRLKLAQEVQNLEKKMPELQKALYDTGDVNFFISLIDKTVRQFGGGDIVIGAGDAAAVDGVKTTQYSVHFTAPLSNVLKVLESLETSPQLSYIQYLKIEHVEKPITTLDMVENPLLDVALQLKFFSKD